MNSIRTWSSPIICILRCAKNNILQLTALIASIIFQTNHVRCAKHLRDRLFLHNTQVIVFHTIPQHKYTASRRVSRSNRTKYHLCTGPIWLFTICDLKSQGLRNHGIDLVWPEHFLTHTARVCSRSASLRFYNARINYEIALRWWWQINYEFANTCKNVLCKRTSFINITIIFYAGVPAIQNIDSSVSEIYQLSLPTLIPVLIHWGRVTHTCDS